MNTTKGRVETKTTGRDGEKEKAIALAVSAIEKQFGKGAILTMSPDGIDKEIQSTSTGSASLDLALGIGGLPRGRVVEIFGPEASGKTTLALHSVAETQRRGGVAAYVDADLLRVRRVHRMLGVDEGADAAAPLGLGDHVVDERRLAG